MHTATQQNPAFNLFGVESVTDLFPEPKHKGVASITQFEFDSKADPFYNMRAIMDGASFMRMYDGQYVRLHVDGELMMSDTAMERRTNREFIDAAAGRVLIAGLGIGLIIKAILKKESVTEIVIIEKYQDVIDIVAPKYTDPRIKYVCADIFEHTLSKEEQFDVIYFDIWASISQDNLPEMRKLHARYRKNLKKDSPFKFIESWMRPYLKKQRVKEQRESRSRWW